MNESPPADGPITLRKPVEALVMVPRTHKLSPLSRKIYNVLLYLSQMALRNMAGIPPATHLFNAPLADVLRVCDAEHQHASAKRYLTEMRRADVVWDSPDSGAELQHVGFALLSESRITNHANGTKWVHWALPPSLYETLIDPERWASIDLVVLARLKTYAAIVLYEICTKYRDNPSKVTCRRAPEWWIELLSATPFPMESATGVRKLPEWRRFKSKFVKSAIDQINDDSDLYIELVEDKQGGKSAKSIQFRVLTKRELRDADLARERSQPPEPGVMQYATSLGVSDPKAIASMTREHGRDAVVDALQKLEQRQKQLALPLVHSPSGYLRTLMRTHAVGAGAAQVPATPSHSAGVAVEEGPVEGSAVAKTPSLEEPLSPEMAWSRERREAAFQEIRSLPLQDQQNWLRAYESVIRAKGLMTAAIERRLASEDWCTGIVKSGVVDFYGSTTYGGDWLKPPATLCA